jgi:DNA-binding beta-propeller fold protein YncE
VTTSYDGQIPLYRPSFRLIESQRAPGGAQPYGLAFSPDGAQIAVGYGDSTRVDVLDGRTLAPMFEADVGWHARRSIPCAERNPCAYGADADGGERDTPACRPSTPFGRTGTPRDKHF